MEPATASGRITSVILDWLILLPFTLGITMYSLLYLKSYPLSLAPSLITLLYKVWMEKTRGATFGKQIAGIQVVDYAGQPLSWSQAFTRSWFFLFSVILGIFQNMELYSIEAVQKAASMEELIEALKMQSGGNTTLQTVSSLLLMLALVDVLYLFMDGQKRTLHDLWAKTFVVKR